MVLKESNTWFSIRIIGHHGDAPDGSGGNLMRSWQNNLQLRFIQKTKVIMASTVDAGDPFTIIWGWATAVSFIGCNVRWSFWHMELLSRIGLFFDASNWMDRFSCFESCDVAENWYHCTTLHKCLIRVCLELSFMF